MQTLCPAGSQGILSPNASLHAKSLDSFCFGLVKSISFDFSIGDM